MENNIVKLKAQQKEHVVEDADKYFLFEEPEAPATVKKSAALTDSRYKNSLMKMMISIANQIRDEGDAAITAVANATDQSVLLQQNEESDQIADLMNNQTIADLAKMSTSNDTKATNQTNRVVKSALAAGGTALNTSQNVQERGKTARKALRTLENHGLV